MPTGDHHARSADDENGREWRLVNVSGRGQAHGTICSTPKAPWHYHKGMGFYFLDDLNTWANADLPAILGCYLTLVASVFAYFLADDESGPAG